VTLIGCKVGAQNRLPASFFVSVAYDCWAFRRLGVELNASSGAIERWLFRDPSHPIIPMLDQSGFMRTGREVREDTAHRRSCAIAEGRRRRAGVGPHVHGPRRVHSHLMKHEPPVDLRGRSSITAVPWS